MQIDLPRRRRQLIGLTPLIDVVFILLLFFMLASTFLDWRAVRLSTPSIQTAGSSATGAILIRLKADGGLDLNGVKMSAAQLAVQLANFLARNPDQQILIRPERRVPLQVVVSALDIVNEAGGSNVILTR